MMMHASRARQRGLNLIEVMAAVLVVCFGLLGLAKIEAVAVSDTTTSDLRSLVAVQAQSLAALMHANPSYWQSSNAVGTCSISGKTVCSSLNGTAASGCLNNICTSSQVASSDLQGWANSMNSLLPGFAATITCSAGETNAANSLTSTQNLYSCAVNISWTEKYVAINKAVAAAQQTARSVTTTYTTTVWP